MKYRPPAPRLDEPAYSWMSGLKPQDKPSWSVHQLVVRGLLAAQHHKHGHFAKRGRLRSNPMCPICEQLVRFVYAWAFIWRPKRDVSRFFNR